MSAVESWASRFRNAGQVDSALVAGQYCSAFRINFPMYTFSQSTGILRHNAVLFGSGWAGQGIGRNNPDSQQIHNIGPLPRGRYSIGKAYQHPHLGPVVMNLTPDDTNVMFGRSDFRIHGAALSHPEVSSEGCIIMPREVRQGLDTGTDKDLEVIE